MDSIDSVYYSGSIIYSSMSGMHKRSAIGKSAGNGNGNGSGNGNGRVKPYNLPPLNPFNNKKSDFKRQKLDDDTNYKDSSINAINIEGEVNQNQEIRSNQNGKDGQNSQDLEYEDGDEVEDGDGDGDEYSAGGHAAGHVSGPVDPYFGQRRAFPVDISALPVSESSEPADVAEYLAMVRVQAQQADREALALAQSKLQLQSQPDAHVGSTEDSPTGGPIDSPDDQESETEQWKSDFSGYYETQRAEYAAYVAGRQESGPSAGEENSTAGSSGSGSAALPATFKEWKRFVFSTRPDDELLYRVESGRQLMTLLVYFAKWLNKSVAPCFAEWITAALIATPDVLTGGEVSVLRGLAKKAAKQLAGTEFQLDGRNMLVMRQIIFVVGIFFGQKDLLAGTGLECGARVKRPPFR